MEPVTLTAIAAIIATGAAAALKDTASTAVKDAYAGVKALVQRKYGNVDLSPVEKRPDSDSKRGSLAEDLESEGAADDTELHESVRRLLEALQKTAPEAGLAIGVDLEKVKAAFLRIGSVEASGTGVRVREGEFSGGIDINSVRAGGGGDRANP